MRTMAASKVCLHIFERSSCKTEKGGGMPAIHANRKKKKSILQKERQKSAKQSAKKLSRHLKPVNMTVVEWQTGLRRDFGRAQEFHFNNIGEDKFFSEF